MMLALSPNTQAILLLTAPLIVGRNSANPDLLSAREYKRLARCLHEIEREPADLLASNPVEVLEGCKQTVDPERLRRLLRRGFQLSQAIERWQTRSIWVVSRADAVYPRRLKERLRGDAPAVLYGCGEVSMLEKGGLAVVGSRHVDNELIDYTMAVGHLAAASGKAIVSGGARGIDQAAMRGALEAGGRVSGVLADSLEKQVMNREHRNMLLNGGLTLVSPYDPNVGFNVGNAMQRNKLIYALADAALVVNSDVNKGGTWAGAKEQLEKFKLVQVYVRSTGERSLGLNQLLKMGALAWPNPDTPEAFEKVFRGAVPAPAQHRLTLGADEEMAENPSAVSIPESYRLTSPDNSPVANMTSEAPDKMVPGGENNPAEVLFAVARQSIERLGATQITEDEVADLLQVEKIQAKKWLTRLVKDGVVEKRSGPVRYFILSNRLL